MEMKFETLKSPLHSNQYYPEIFPKKYIFLHHTAGTDVAGAISWWNSKPDHVATALIIDRDGKVYQCFNPNYWSYALGVKGATFVEKASVQIEIVAGGKLDKRGGEYFIQGTRDKINPEEVVEFKNFYRECYFYHKYTPAQIKAVTDLLPGLCELYKIKPQNGGLTNFWYYNKDWIKTAPSGIWSHSTVRSDKSDIMPQKEFIEALYALKF